MEIPFHIGGEEPPDELDLLPEPLVADGTFRERSERPETVVGLPEHTESEQTDRDEQHRSSHEGDEELGVNLRRKSADASNEKIIARTQPPHARGDQ
jgi:hypothetical protein